MRCPVFFVLLLTPAIALPLRSQSAQDAAPATSTLQMSTQLVVVTVTVRDRNGKPVPNLSQSSFEVREDNKPQPVHYFLEEHPEPGAASNGVDQAAARTLPPGVFVDLDPLPAKGPLNVLLLDTLNTPIKDQVYLRLQLIEYLREMKPGTSIAIFGLASRLYMLQGFSTSPEMLRRALTHAPVAPSTLLPAAADGNTSSTTGSDVVAASASPPPAAPGGAPGSSQILDTAAVLSQFEADVEASQTQVRSQTTVEALNGLAHYLSALPGRKNLLWFSGSFPLALLPDPTAGSQATSTFMVNELLKNTTALLARAQVAVYPIDAHGLIVNPIFSASQSGQRYGLGGLAYAQDVARFQAGLAQEHNTEMEIAEESGGHAFFNTNSLAAAAKAAIEDGSNYYVLEYRPTNHAESDAYRKIEVKLQGSVAAAGYTLEYRRGYYLVGSRAAATPAAGSGSSGFIDPANTYARAAMSRGAPAPTEILFTASVLPASARPEATLASDIKSDPAHPLQPPYRRFHVTFALMPKDLRLVQEENGNHIGRLTLLAFLYNAGGELVLSNGRDLTFNLDPAKYKEFLQMPIRYSMDIDAPVRGESYLRLGVHDLKANHFGVIEVPVASLPDAAIGAR